MSISAKFRIYRHIIKAISEESKKNLWDGPLETEDDIEEALDEIPGVEFYFDDWLDEALDEFRCGGELSNIESPDSRYYESESRWCELSDGSKVGWTYWFGGGKHGEPSSIDWINNAYDIELVSEKTITVYEFKKLEEQP